MHSMSARHRLDGSAPPLVVIGATTLEFIMSGVNFPTLGYWENHGNLKGPSSNS